MILFWLVVETTGVLRLSRWYAPISEKEQAWVLLQLKQHLLLPLVRGNEGADGGQGVTPMQENDRSHVLRLPRSPFSGTSSRVVYRRHGTLFCVAAISGEEVPLVTRELIDMWVGLLRQLFGIPAGPTGSFIEAQLAAHMEVGLVLLDCMLQDGYLVCSDAETLLTRTREILKQD